MIEGEEKVREIQDIAKDIMDYAHSKGYGLAEFLTAVTVIAMAGAAELPQGLSFALWDTMHDLEEYFRHDKKEREVRA